MLFQKLERDFMSNKSISTETNTNLGDLLISVLKVHNSSWINSKGIMEKANSNPDFVGLNEVSIGDVRATLNEMAELNKIRKRKSEKGDWFLYRL